MDFIEICLAPKLLSNAEIRQFYLDQGQSAAQIARHFGVSRATIVSRLHDMGIRQEALPERYTNPENYRRSNPPYGYQIQDGKLVPNKAELRVCKLIVELIQRGGQNQNEVARELSRRGFKNRAGRQTWNSKTVFNIYKRWKDKL